MPGLTRFRQRSATPFTPAHRGWPGRAAGAGGRIDCSSAVELGCSTAPVSGGGRRRLPCLRHAGRARRRGRLPPACASVDRAALGPARRRGLHRGAAGGARLLAGGADPARLAHHAEGAGDAAACSARARGGTWPPSRRRRTAAQYAGALRFARARPPGARQTAGTAGGCGGTDDQVDSIASWNRAIDCYREAGAWRRGGVRCRLVTNCGCRGDGRCARGRRSAVGWLSRWARPGCRRRLRVDGAEALRWRVRRLHRLGTAQHRDRRRCRRR